MPELTADDLRALSDKVGHRWWHSIDLGQGVVTPGTKPVETMRAEIAALDLPADLTGKSVLDIGAWDGGFSFEAERRGAERVVAVDHYIWSVDLDAQQTYLARCEAEGVTPQPWEHVPEVWKPDQLPGKLGFDTAHEALGSKVETVVDDFMTMDLSRLGQFDIVFYLGVLYHIRDPFEALTRLAQVTREHAIIETEMLVVPGAEHYAVCEFIPDDALGRDPGNWWVPNRLALKGLLESAGFARVEVPAGPVATGAHRPRPAGAKARARAVAGQAKRAGLAAVAEARQGGGRHPDVAPIRYRTVAHAWK